MQVGVRKGPESEVYATAVYEFLPMIKLMANKYTLSVCDDIIDNELDPAVKAQPENNDFILCEIHAE